MIDPANVPPVADEEGLVRYIVQRSQVRSDGTVKADAFVPHPHRELSVNRCLAATEAETWQIGAAIAAKRQRALLGRADVTAQVFGERKLRVLAAAIPGNPNHANVVDWPAEKHLQKLLALEIAALAAFTPVPETV